MNFQLHYVLSDIKGVTEIKILRSIIAGERDFKVLLQYRDSSCCELLEIIEKLLQEHYREEPVFAIKQAVELYDIYRNLRNKLSGGKCLSSRILPSVNKVTKVFRMAVSSLYRNQSVCDAFHHRLKSSLGMVQAVAAKPHKLVPLFYILLKEGKKYIESGGNYYEIQYCERVVNNLK